MGRYALLIGVGTYTEGLPQLEAPPKDVAALQEVLMAPQMGGFDEVKPLVDPAKPKMAEEIELWFLDRQREDLVLMYFSGHGIKDANRKLYFAAIDTKIRRGSLLKSSAIPARDIHDWIHGCKAQSLVLILDCCFSGAFGGQIAKDVGEIPLKEQLEADGRVVLTSTSSVDYSFAQKEADLSTYTCYLVNGIASGAADENGDGKITIDEWHRYAERKAKEVSSVMKPDLIALKGYGYRIEIANSPLGRRVATPAIQSQLDQNDLSSGRFGANYYAKLYNLLAAQDWKAADQETAERMCEVMNRRQKGYLRIRDIKDFPCQDLRNIDQLWVKYSNGKFGFSVQVRIWESSLFASRRASVSFRQNFVWFSTAVGWLTKSILARWMNYSQLTFSLQAQEGHLPARWAWAPNMCVLSKGLKTWQSVLYYFSISIGNGGGACTILFMILDGRGLDFDPWLMVALFLIISVVCFVLLLVSEFRVPERGVRCISSLVSRFKLCDL